MCRPPVTAHGVCLLRRLDSDANPGSYSRPVPKSRKPLPVSQNWVDFRSQLDVPLLTSARLHLRQIGVICGQAPTFCSTPPAPR
jgi:hypothetical protein